MRKILVAGGITAAAVAAVIGAASTNAIGGVSTHGAQTVGYGSAVITGATVDNVAYHVDATADDQLDSVTVTFHDNLLNKTIKVGFGTAALVPCDSSATTVTNASGVVQDDTLGNTAATVVTCDLGTSQTVSDATAFRLLVTG